jgi:hypothetical protein
LKGGETSMRRGAAKYFCILVSLFLFISTLFAVKQKPPEAYRLQYLEPSKDFRTTFQYQNLYDIFELYNELLEQKQKVSFFTDNKGNIGSLSVQLEPAVKEIVFFRAAAKEAKITQPNGVFTAKKK